MKNTIKAAAVIALSLFAAACAKVTTDEPSKEGQELHFIVNTAENAVVKSFIESNHDGTYAPKWSKGDELAIFVGAIDKNTKPTGVLSNLNEKGTLARFDGIVTGIEGDGTFKSFTPASAFTKGFDSGNVGITLAESQKPSSLTIDEACDILVAKEANYTADANGEVAIDNLLFKRMFSIVKVALNGPEGLNGEKVQKFSFTAPEGTVLTGRAVINLSTATVEKWTISNNTVSATYSEDAPLFGGAEGLENEVWLVVNPGTIASGAKVTFAGETAGYTFSKEVTLSKDLVFPESQLAVINLTLADENCTKKATPAAASWIATDLADITATDEVVITMAKGDAVYAMTSDNGTKNPSAVLVTVKAGELSATPADNLVWNISNDNGNLTIYPNGQTDKWLYSDTKTDVKVGNSATNKIFTLDATTKYLKNTGANRYLGVYNSQDWRCYASATGTSNIAGQTLCFYVNGTPKTATPEITIDKAGVVSISCATAGATIHYTVGDSPADPTEADAVFSTVTLTDGQTIKAIAVAEGFKPSAVASKKYSIIEEKDFSKTYSFGLEGWSLTEYTKQKDYYLVPSGNNPSVATIPSIFVGKTIKSDIVISLNVATYGNGTDPSASTFSIFNSSDCMNSVSATQSGTLPTSKTYTDVVYTVKASDAVSLTSDLAIKITKPGKQIRLKTIKVDFKYSE